MAAGITEFVLELKFMPALKTSSVAAWAYYVGLGMIFLGEFVRKTGEAQPCKLPLRVTGIDSWYWGRLWGWWQLPSGRDNVAVEGWVSRSRHHSVQ